MGRERLRGSRSLLPFHRWLEALITFSLKDLKKKKKESPYLCPISVISQAGSSYGS